MPQRNLLHAVSSLGVLLFIVLGAGAPGLASGNLTGNFYAIPSLATNGTSTALAVSADGSVVAGLSNDTDLNATPVTWTLADGTVAFADTGNWTSLTPTGASNSTGNGTFVVGTGVTNGSVVPFVYNGTTLTALTLYGNDTAARATGVSEDGSVAVNGQGANSTLTNPYLYSPNNSGGYTINPLSITGGVYDVDTNGDNLAYMDSGARAAIYHYISATKSIAPALTGNYVYIAVNGISPGGGFVAGLASNNATTGQLIQRGYLYDSANLTSTVLQPFSPSDIFSTCRAVSDATPFDGAVGGGSSGSSTAFVNERAVLFDSALGVTIDLRQMLLSQLYTITNNSTADLGNWTLNEVHGISSDGKTIVGDGFYKGFHMGFVVALDNLPQESTVPAWVVTPSSQTVNLNGNVTFTALAVPGKDNSDPTYTWYFNGNSTALAGQTSNTLTLANLQPTNAGTYKVVAAVAGQTSINSTATLSLAGHLPVISPSKKTVNTGGSVTLKVTDKDATTGFQWSFNGTAITGATNTTLTMANLTSANGGNYTVTANTTQYGNITSNPAVLIVNYRPVITTQPTAQTVTAGSPVTLSVVAMGAPNPTFQWYIHNMAMGRAAAKQANFTIPVTHIPDGGVYRVRVLNNQGYVYSNTVQLTVLPINGNTTSSGNTTNGGNTTGGNNTFGGGG